MFRHRWLLVAEDRIAGGCHQRAGPALPALAAAALALADAGGAAGPGDLGELRNDVAAFVPCRPWHAVAMFLCAHSVAMVWTGMAAADAARAVKMYSFHFLFSFSPCPSQGSKQQ